jgi:DNA mismatch repair protein MutS
VKSTASELHTLASSLAALDVATSLADLKLECNLTRPTLTHGFEFEILDGRHLVVEQSLKKTGKPFTPNSCSLSFGENIILLTGPNMAGKSTYLRQTALMAILAQAGIPLPASSATIGLVDKVFSRVGASDDLARGQSTFMMEMVETATILNRSTETSLVILDEIGRGTATYDGLAIAWSCLEYLHNVNRSRAIFATHYHELTQLSESLSHLQLSTMKVQEWKNEIIFLHQVIAGTADKSYGVHVAKLAGLPSAAIIRAEQVLKQITNANKSSQTISNELPLFSQNIAPVPEPEHPALLELREINPDSLSPREALETLYVLTKKAHS